MYLHSKSTYCDLHYQSLTRISDCVTKCCCDLTEFSTHHQVHTVTPKGYLVEWLFFNKSFYIFCSLPWTILSWEQREAHDQLHLRKTKKPDNPRCWNYVKKTGRWISQIKSTANKTKHELCIAGGKIDSDGRSSQTV